MEDKHISPALVNRATAARILSVSISQLKKFEAAGELKAVRFPGIRRVAYRYGDVLELAENFVRASR